MSFLRRSFFYSILAAQQPETDGPLGSIFLAEALMARGKKVTLVTDRHCLSAITACCDVIKEKIDSGLFTISLFPEEEREAFVSNLCDGVLETSAFCGRYAMGCAPENPR